MKLYSYICFLIFLIISVNDVKSGNSDNLECKDIISKSPETRLRKHLFCEYDTTVRPAVRKDNTTTVIVKLFPKFMEFEESGIFTLHAWMYFSWTDAHLTWDPFQFENVQEIRVHSNELWVPDFTVYNSGDMAVDQTGVASTWCVVTKSGKVSCVPAVKYSTLCEADYTLWPYDTQNCTIRFGSWAHTGEEINFNFGRTAIDMGDFVSDSQWDVISYNASKHVPKYACCPNESFPTLKTSFIFRRHSRMNHAVYVTPAAVLIVITLTTLWLDSKSIERISMAAVNFICHILCIYDLHWMVPANGANPPHILLFYRDSLLLATFTMIMTTLLRKLYYVAVPPPSWVSSTVSYVLNFRAGQFLLNDSEAKSFATIGGDNDDTMETIQTSIISEAKEDTTWRRLAVIIEWLSFVFVFITYAILLLLLIPSDPDTEIPTGQRKYRIGS